MIDVLFQKDMNCFMFENIENIVKAIKYFFQLDFFPPGIIFTLKFPGIDLLCH